MGVRRRDETDPIIPFQDAEVGEGWLKGFEPSTLGTTIRCSNQLSYSHRVGPGSFSHFAQFLQSGSRRLGGGPRENRREDPPLFPTR